MTRSGIRQGIDRFLHWLQATGYASHDPYDIQGTRYSLWARRIYYRQPLLGLPLIAPLLLTEILAPSLRRLFAHRDRFATADGLAEVAAHVEENVERSTRFSKTQPRDGS